MLYYISWKIAEKSKYSVKLKYPVMYAVYSDEIHDSNNKDVNDIKRNPT